jgi:hypothetical protein
MTTPAPIDRQLVEALRVCTSALTELVPELDKRHLRAVGDALLIARAAMRRVTDPETVSA